MNPSGVIVSKRLVIVNSLSSVLSKILNATLLIWVYQYLVKRVDPTEYSLLPVVTSIMVFAPLLTTVLTGGIGRFILEAHAKREDHRVAQIVSSLTPLLSGAALLVLAVGGTLAWNIHHVLNIAPDRIWDARLMLGLLMFGLAVRLPFAPFGVGLYVHQRFVLLNGIELGGQCIRIVLLLIFLKLWGPKVIWVVVANWMTSMMTLIVTQIYSRRLMPTLKLAGSCFDWSVARQLMSFGGWNFVAQLGATIRESADPIVLNKLASPIDVAAFHLGSVPDRQIRHMTIAVTAPLIPALTAIHAVGETDRLRELFLRLGRYSAWLAMIIAVPLMVFRTEFYQLYLGDRYETYHAASSVMLLLLVGYPLFYANTMTTKIAFAQGRIRSLALITFFTQIINVLLTVYLVGQLKMGALGSPTATLIVDLGAILFLYLPLGLRLVNVSVFRWLYETLTPAIIPTIVGGAAWLSIRAVAEPQSWLSLFLCCLAGAIVYVGAVLACASRLDGEQLVSAFPFLSRLIRKLNSNFISVGKIRG